jgi:P27 family predicted phage terminase small subunit
MRTDVLTELPAAPPSFSPAATAAWERLGRLVIQAGTLTRFDTELLSLAARTTATCEELEAQLAADGVLLQSKGAIKAHPAAAALDRSRTLLLKLLNVLGLPPADRDRIPMAPTSKLENRFTWLTP